MPSPPAGSVVVVGAGPIGIGWSIAFARAGRSVILQDVDRESLHSARRALETRVDRLDAHGLLPEPATTLVERVQYADVVAWAATGVAYIQECVGEDLRHKRQLFETLDAEVDPGVVIASSSSALTTSAIAGHLPGRRRCLTAHPANPPYLLPVVEVVPAPFTDASAVEAARSILEQIGMHPVVLRREQEGFAMNRLQGALLREAYCLVRDGVLDVDGVDALVRDGIGRRWAFAGPFETADLNTRGGIRAHAERLGPAYARMGADRGQSDSWDSGLVDAVTEQRRRLLDLEEWSERNLWREEKLMELAAILEDQADRPSACTSPSGSRVDRV